MARIGNWLRLGFIALSVATGLGFLLLAIGFAGFLANDVFPGSIPDSIIRLVDQIPRPWLRATLYTLTILSLAKGVVRALWIEIIFLIIETNRYRLLLCCMPILRYFMFAARRDELPRELDHSAGWRLVVDGLLELFLCIFAALVIVWLIDRDAANIVFIGASFTVSTALGLASVLLDWIEVRRVGGPITQDRHGDVFT